MRWLLLLWLCSEAIPLRAKFGVQRQGFGVRGRSKRDEDSDVSDDPDDSPKSDPSPETDASDTAEANTLANGVREDPLSPSPAPTPVPLPVPLPMINTVNDNLAQKQALELRSLAKKQASEVTELVTERTQLLQDQPVERQNQRVKQTQELAAQQKDFRFNVRPKDKEDHELAALKARQAQDVQNLIAKQARELADIELRMHNLKKRQVEEFKVLMNAQQMDRDEVGLMNEHDLKGTPLTYLSTGRLITPAVARAMKRVDQATGEAVRRNASDLFAAAQPPQNNMTDNELWNVKLTMQYTAGAPLLDLHDLDVAVPHFVPIGNPTIGEDPQSRGDQGQSSELPSSRSMSSSSSSSSSSSNGLSGSSSSGGSSSVSSSSGSANGKETLLTRFAAANVRSSMDPSDAARIAILAPDLPVTLKQIDQYLDAWANRPERIGTVLGTPPIVDSGEVCDCCLKKIAPDPMPPIAIPGGCHCPSCTKGLTYDDFTSAAGQPVVGFPMSANSTKSTG